jgi:hypothetical protein
MANRNFSNGKSIYIPHVKPVLLDCNFIVDSANGNGYGVRSLKGPMIAKVFMHTTATPAAGSPNPSAGYIVVQLQDNYNRYLSGFSGVVAPLSGSALAVTAVGAALTPGVAYVLTSLGTTTTADWHTLGVPAGVTPAVGVAFIAAVSGTGVGSGTVMLSASSAVAHIEVVGDPNLSIGPDPTVNQGYGAQFILQCVNGSNAVTAPTDGTVISLSFYLNDSSVTVQGE